MTKIFPAHPQEQWAQARADLQQELHQEWQQLQAQRLNSLVQTTLNDFNICSSPKSEHRAAGSHSRGRTTSLSTKSFWQGAEKKFLLILVSQFDGTPTEWKMLMIGRTPTSTTAHQLHRFKIKT